MARPQKLILVPTDFSHVAECAINHAGMIAQKSENSLLLLHIITKEIQSELSKKNETFSILEKKLKLQAQYYQSKFNVAVDFLLKEGSIFNEIGSVASEVNASLIIMGTHGVKGIQHFTGAYAIKVIASSKVPIIIVQNKLPRQEGYYEIVSPIDASFDTRQKTLQTIAIAKIFNAKVHLFKMSASDSSAENEIQLNVNYVKKFLNDHEILFTLCTQENKGGDFIKDLFSYSKKVQADLIIILTTAQKGIKDKVLGPVEQQIINNIEQIPVMCVNPLQSIYKNEAMI
ncbi:MAG: universal stress protein [Bacteroidota bacterium]|nr:universal stress protein [Bacteroidota bacterium]